jgi:hypothetical protein
MLAFMSTATKTPPALDPDPVVTWRSDRLLQAGYPPQDASVLAVSPEVDLHTAVDLLDRGCPLELALQILL